MKTTTKKAKRTEFLTWESATARVIFNSLDREYVGTIEGAFFACGNLEKVERELRSAGHSRPA